MSKHTPGPWKVVEQLIPHYLGGHHVARTIYTGWDHPQMKGPLPVVCIATGIPENHSDEAVRFCSISDADARLISTAPRLLKALIGLVDAVNPESPGWDEAANAIEEATGTEQ